MHVSMWIRERKKRTLIPGKLADFDWHHEVTNLRFYDISQWASLIVRCWLMPVGDAQNPHCSTAKMPKSRFIWILQSWALCWLPRGTNYCVFGGSSSDYQPNGHFALWCHSCLGEWCFFILLWSTQSKEFIMIYVLDRNLSNRSQNSRFWGRTWPLSCSQSTFCWLLSPPKQGSSEYNSRERHGLTRWSFFPTTWKLGIVLLFLSFPESELWWEPEQCLWSSIPAFTRLPILRRIEVV